MANLIEPDKAIEILELNLKLAGKKMPADTAAAVSLGIEALKRHKAREHLTYSGMLLPLPGETVETDSP